MRRRPESTLIGSTRRQPSYPNPWATDFAEQPTASALSPTPTTPPPSPPGWTHRPRTTQRDPYRGPVAPSLAISTAHMAPAHQRPRPGPRSGRSHRPHRRTDHRLVLRHPRHRHRSHHRRPHPRPPSAQPHCHRGHERTRRPAARELGHRGHRPLPRQWRHPSMRSPPLLPPSGRPRRARRTERCYDPTSAWLAHRPGRYCPSRTPLGLCVDLVQGHGE